MIIYSYIIGNPPFLPRFFLFILSLLFSLFPLLNRNNNNNNNNKKYHFLQYLTRKKKGPPSVPPQEGLPACLPACVSYNVLSWPVNRSDSEVVKTPARWGSFDELRGSFFLLDERRSRVGWIWCEASRVRPLLMRVNTRILCVWKYIFNSS